MEALSKIEIAFARMRDLMHLERMEECAREEEKLMDSTSSFSFFSCRQPRLTCSLGGLQTPTLSSHKSKLDLPPFEIANSRPSKPATSSLARRAVS